MRIELKDVKKNFGHIQALKGLQADLPAGSRIGLIGPNGSGKSTLIRVLSGLIACEGVARLDGLDPLRDRARLAPRLAYVPQNAPQFRARVGDVVEALATARAVEPALIGQHCQALNLDLSAVATQAFRDLSGGMKQKVLLACALAAPVELLILDEPTASLDADSRDRFFSLYHALTPKPALILCSHRLEEVRALVDQLLVLEDGQVRYQGPADRALSEQVQSVIELCVRGHAHDAWLTERGFRAGAAGWWLQSVVQKEKVGLLPTVLAQLGANLVNVLVRDQEQLEPSSDEAAHASR